MFRGPYFITSTRQEGTTTILKVFGITGPSTNRESNFADGMDVCDRNTPNFQHKIRQAARGEICIAPTLKKKWYDC